MRRIAREFGCDLYIRMILHEQIERVFAKLWCDARRMPKAQRITQIQVTCKNRQLVITDNG